MKSGNFRSSIDTLGVIQNLKKIKNLKNDLEMIQTIKETNINIYEMILLRFRSFTQSVAPGLHCVAPGLQSSGAWEVKVETNAFLVILAISKNDRKWALNLPYTGDLCPRGHTMWPWGNILGKRPKTQ